MKEKNKDLEYILNELGLDKLPKKEKPGIIWTKAICKITKRDGSTTYGLLKTTNRLERRVVLVLGSVSPIYTIDEIYPYEELNKDFIQKFENDNIEDRIEYLKGLNLPYINTLDFEKMDLNDLNKEIVCSAIYLQSEFKSK